MGVPREAILTETKATNTGENIRFTQVLLKEKGISAFLTLPYHSLQMQHMHAVGARFHA